MTASSKFRFLFPRLVLSDFAVHIIHQPKSGAGRRDLTGGRSVDLQNQHLY